jgi:Cu(I)/Ag(I) efflux system protein CusF
MKRLTSLCVVLILTVGAAITAHAQMKDMDSKGMDSGKTGQGTVHKGTGVVKKVDTEKGAVTLDHEAIKSLGWPAMVMSFNVKDKKMLGNLKSGQKVQFEFVQQGRENVITSMK